jgi:hypothetical protein
MGMPSRQWGLRRPKKHLGPDLGADLSQVAGIDQPHIEEHIVAKN